MIKINLIAVLIVPSSIMLSSMIELKTIVSSLTNIRLIGKLLMQRRLPPLSALRAFEATSRLLSAKKAAEELFVTPAAISHQIKALEEYLDLKLFKRQNRQLLLTEAGLRYAASLQKVFDHLFDETQEVMKFKEKNYLTISVEPAFALYWLIPRLNKFKEHHPDIELRVLATLELIDLKKSNVAIGIRWGQGTYPGLNSTLLFHNVITPVCSPSIIKKHPIKEPNDLKHHNLLRLRTFILSTDYPTWHTWLNAVGGNEVDPESGLAMESGYMLLQAAINGQGVALERKALVEPLIKSGQLIQPFDFSIQETTTGYYIVFSESDSSDPKIQAVIKWLISETKNEIF